MTSVPTEPKDIKDLHSDHAHLFYCRDGYLYLAQCGAVDEVEFDPDHPGDPIRNCSWPDKGWFLQWGDGPMLGYANRRDAELVWQAVDALTGTKQAPQQHISNKTRRTTP